MSNIPKLRFREFEGEYKEYLFHDIFLFSTGKNIKQKEASPEFEIPCIRYGELYHMYNEVVYKIINRTNLDKSELLFSQGNEILLPSAGEDPLDIGSASALTLKNIAIGRTINILRPKHKNIYSQKYVSYYINEKLKRKISTLAKGSSISNVYNSDLKKLKIILPTLDEQQKIDDFITSIDKKIEQLKQKKTLLENYKKGLMQKIFSQEIRFKRDDGREFEDWEEKRLGNIGKLVKGLTYSPDNICKDGLLVLRSSNIQNNQISLLDNVYVNLEVKNEYLTQENDILICVRNGSKRLIGKSTIISKNLEKSTHGAFMTIFRSSSNNFLSHWFETSMYYKEVHKNLGATINSINGSDLKKFKLKIPSIEEQEKIAIFLSSIDQKITQNNKLLEQMKMFKKGLLQQMFV
jgi:type I restriction enzyme S subunit